MKFLCFSDVHLDAVTAGVSRFEEIEARMLALETAAVQAQVQAVVFCGDLSDPDSACAHRASECAVRLAMRLAAAGIASRWLVGNHDVVENGDGSSVLSPLRPLVLSHQWQHGCTPAIVVWNEPMVEVLDDVCCVALPCTSRSFSYDPAAFVQGAQCGGARHVVVFSHLNVDGIVPGSETIDMARGRDVVLPRAAIRARWPHALIMQGHYHAPQRFDDVHVIGSLVRLRFDEANNATGYSVIDLP